MKISIEVDMTPQEAREFLGLPNVERIQEQLVKSAENYLKESSGTQYGELIATAMQPMVAYQQWLQRMMTGSSGQSSSEKPSSTSSRKGKTKS